MPHRIWRRPHIGSPRALGGRALILLAAVLLGTSGTAHAFLPAAASVAQVGAFRMLAAGVLFAMWMLATGGLRTGARWPLVPTLTVGLSMAGFQIVYFGAMRESGVAVGTIVAIASGTLLSGLLGFLVRGERPGSRWLAMTLVALVGCAFLAIGDGNVTSATTLGVALALAAGMLYAVFALASKVLLDVHAPEAVVSVTFIVAAVAMLPFLVIGDVSWVFNPGSLALLAYLGLVTSGLGFVLWLKGLRTVSIGNTVSLSLAEPMTAAALGVILLGERLPLLGVLGLLLVFGSVILLAVGPRAVRQPRVPDAPPAAGTGHAPPVGGPPQPPHAPWGDPRGSFK